MNALLHVTHECIPIFIDDNSKILFLGSLPSVKSRENGFYYAHKRNRFFLVLSHLFNEDEPLTIEQRKAFLKKHNIALYDVIYECDIYGSSDSSIKNVKVIDIIDILSKYPNISKICINGGKAKEMFDKYLVKDIDTNIINIYYLPSTSPANAKMGVNQLVDAYKAILD